MALITATIKPVHDDATVCTHSVTSTGKPKDPQSGCTGRSGYIARCTATDCSWRRSDKQRAVVVDLSNTHVRSHLNQPLGIPRQLSRTDYEASLAAGLTETVDAFSARTLKGTS